MDALVVTRDEVVTLAHQVAMVRGGSSTTGAGAAALRHYLDCERTKAERVADILRIAAEVRATLRPPLPTSDHSWLYDQNGFPA